jgi:hypothetical protein
MKTGGEIFAEPRTEVLEETEENEMVRESNSEEVLEHRGEKRDSVHIFNQLNWVDSNKKLTSSSSCH